MATGVSKNFSPVERDLILTELIRREERLTKLSESFSVPVPARLKVVPSKPNATTPAAQPTEAQLAAAEATLARLAGVKHAHKAGRGAVVWGVVVFL